jgi:hypothetical protein
MGVIMNDKSTKLIDQAREFFNRKHPMADDTSPEFRLTTQWMASFAQHVLDKQWTLIEGEDSLPKEVLTGGRLLQVLTDYGKTRILRAEYFPKYTVEEYGDNDADECDEKGGVCYFPEGWYECNEIPEDVIYPVNGKAIAWMPLPQPYVRPEKQEGK